MGHIAGITAAVTGFISTIVLSAFSLAVLLQIRTLRIVQLFDMCNIISGCLFI
jgi:hypothetical protein